MCHTTRWVECSVYISVVFRCGLCCFYMAVRIQTHTFAQDRGALISSFDLSRTIDITPGGHQLRLGAPHASLWSGSLKLQLSGVSRQAQGLQA